MNGRSLGLAVVLVALAALLCLTALPLNSLISPAPAAPATPATPEASSAAASPAPVSSPHPQIGCAGYPIYGELDGYTWPLDPNMYLQYPCAPIAEDEMHLSFDSPSAGSGDHLTVPWYLPPESADGQENATAGMYLGMVVSGDANSAWNQSYLELQATPLGFGSLQPLVWNITLAVLSFVNSTDSVGCAVAAVTGWNGTYWCEFDDLSSNDPLPFFNVPGGSWIQVSFAGTPNGNGLSVFVNQTSNGNANGTYTLSQSVTGTHTFNPSYSAACADSCELDWAVDPSTGSGQQYGLGFGVDVCPEGAAAYAPCDTYNGSRWANLTATEIGVPLFWNGTSYSGTYSLVSPESASGTCDTAPPLGVDVGTCWEFTSAGGDGFYPYFALNGNNSAAFLTYGMSYATTRTDWGGAYGQYLSTSGAQDLYPLAVTHVADSSLGGYIAPATPLNVTARATALGYVRNVTLAFDSPGGPWTTALMTSTGGTNEDGTYLATIPAAGNGKFEYWVNATDAAGEHVSNGPYSVTRGPIPHFSVVTDIQPSTCGSVTLNGTVETNGSALGLEPGSTSATAVGCYPYAFASWTVTGGVTVGTQYNLTTSVSVEGNGTLTANWAYIRPHENVLVDIAPSTCGVVDVNGTPYGDGTTASLLFDIPVALTETVSCAGDGFAGWTVVGNLTILGTLLTPGGNGTITASYVSESSSSAVEFETSPSDCGGISYQGASYTNGESVYLAAGTYTVAPSPCRHYGFQNFSSSGGVSIAGDSMTVSGSGVLFESNYKLTEVFVDTVPSACGGITLNGTDYANGADIAVQNHSVYSIVGYTCHGHYLESMTASGGLTLIGSLLLVNGTGTILVVSFAGTPEVYVGILTNPSSCGGVNLGGNVFSNGGFTTESPGAVLSISAIPCQNYGFTGYTLSGGIQVVGDTVWLNNSGAIQADFGPLVNLVINTYPATCGSVILGGTTYLDGSEATLITGLTYTIGATACAHYGLISFDSSPYVAIANGTITPTGPSTITAEFAPLQYTVLLETGGSGCGSITINGALEPSGAHLLTPFDQFAVGTQPCVTSSFSGWNVTGNVSVSGSELYVNGSGNLTALFVPTPPTVSIGGASVGYVGTAVEFLAEVPVLVASSGYTYQWTFGDGNIYTNASNATSHTYTSPGVYKITVEVVDPYHRSANASTTITIESTSIASSGITFSSAFLAIGIAAIALVALFLLARRPPPPASPAPAPTLARPQPSTAVEPAPPPGPG